MFPPTLRLSRRSLLAAGGAGAAAFAGRALGSAAPKNLITVFADGGWDTTYSLDPKLGLVTGPERDATADPDDVDAVATFSGIPIVVNPVRRPAIGAFFAAWADRCTLVNGVWCGAVGHPLARNRLLSGTDSLYAPDLNVAFGVGSGDSSPIAAFDLGHWQRRGDHASRCARLAGRDQAATLVDPAASPLPPPAVGDPYPRFVPSAEQQAALDAYRAGAVARARALWSDAAVSDARFDADLDAAERAGRLAAAAAGLDLAAPATVVDRAPIAVSLLTAGVTRSIAMSESAFDTHMDTVTQNKLQDGLFRGLYALVSGLDAAGILEDTLVVVFSELTRTPAINSMGGKDHWPHTNFLFVGGGVAGGRLLGGTDDRQESLAVDLGTGELDPRGSIARYDQIHAGILEYLGVDPEEWHPDVTPWRGLTPA